MYMFRLTGQSPGTQRTTSTDYQQRQGPEVQPYVRAHRNRKNRIPAPAYCESRTVPKSKINGVTPQRAKLHEYLTVKTEEEQA